VAGSVAAVTEESLGYERAREELAEVVRRLEAGGLSLEESLALWERGERLADVCAQWLDGARRRLDAALEDGDGAAPTDRA
jgi:exodeoxyribonuclease VII small subunit